MSQRAAGRWRIYDRVVITTGRAEASERTTNKTVMGWVLGEFDGRVVGRGLKMWLGTAEAGSGLRSELMGWGFLEGHSYGGAD